MVRESRLRGSAERSGPGRHTAASGNDSGDSNRLRSNANGMRRESGVWSRYIHVAYTKGGTPFDGAARCDRAEADQWPALDDTMATPQASGARPKSGGQLAACRVQEEERSERRGGRGRVEHTRGRPREVRRHAVKQSTRKQRESILDVKNSASTT